MTKILLGMVVHTWFSFLVLQNSNFILRYAIFIDWQYFLVGYSTFYPRQSLKMQMNAVQMYAMQHVERGVQNYTYYTYMYSKSYHLVYLSIRLVINFIAIIKARDWNFGLKVSVYSRLIKVISYVWPTPIATANWWLNFSIHFISNVWKLTYI